MNDGHTEDVTRPAATVKETFFDDFEGRFAKVEHYMATQGYAFSPSRMGSHWRAFQRFLAERRNGGRMVGLDELKRIHQAIDDLEELEVIIAEIGEADIWRRKLEKGIGGRLLPEQEEGFTPARDTIFELYVAAVAHRAGFSVSPNEPDLIISREHVELAIACKRIKSRTKLIKRIREAGMQLQSSGQSGILLIDVSSLLNRSNIGLATTNLGNALVFSQRSVDELVEKNAAAVRQAVNLQITEAAVFYFRAMAFLIPKKQFVTIRCVTTQELRSPAPRKAFIRSLTKGFL